MSYYRGEIGVHEGVWGRLGVHEIGVHEPFWLGVHKSGQIGVHKLGVHGGSGGVHE